ncbi:MAG: PLP-dependent transferase [Elusimicrobia bacterium]|nr:PLP-dependent transferase [Elusimicrobiota bacterium]
MKKRDTIEGYRRTTWIVHGPARTAKWDYAHHVVPPMTSSTTYRLESARRGAQGFQEYGALIRDRGKAPVYIYDRLDDPTRELLEGELAKLEGGDGCLTFASGMAAISAALAGLLQSGDEIIGHDLLYGCTHSLMTRWLPRLGISVRRADFTRPDSVARLINPRTRLLYYESPVNPTLDLVDIATIRRLCDAHNRLRPKERRLLSIIDNTFATPFCQRPLELGVDVVVHSLTKNIGGFGTEVGGALICGRELYPALKWFRKDFGGILASKSAWSILVYGLPTLPVRVKRQQYTALKVARFLRSSPRVETVRYPGLPDFPQRALATRQMRDFDGSFAPGNMIYFRLKKDNADPVRFINDLAKNAYSITLAVSLGHVKTLVEIPGSMTHSAYEGAGAIKDVDGVRLSIGLESPADIIRDLESSLERAARRGRR